MTESQAVTEAQPASASGHIDRQRAWWAVVAASLVFLAAGCNYAWGSFGYGADQTRSTPDTGITTANVTGLTQAWTATGVGAWSSPAVSGGVLYIGNDNGQLDAFDSTGVNGCTGTPTTCTPLWTASTGSQISSPAVGNGDVYVAGATALYAFDAAGATNCSGTPKVCTPLWTAPIDTYSYGESSPTISGTTLYLTTADGLAAYDATGTTNCTGTPKACSPLWTSTGTNLSPVATPTVANGVVYATTSALGIAAFDATGTTDCSGTPKTCQATFTDQAPNEGPANSSYSSPAVAGGLVYDTSEGVDAFDAAGVTNCTGTPKVCTPVWSAVAGGFTATYSSPAVANNVLYTSAENTLYAYDSTGTTNCTGTPKVCTPLWTAQTHNVSVTSVTTPPCGAPPGVQCTFPLSYPQMLFSSPDVAGGIVYVGSSNAHLYAFTADGSTNCTGTPKVCSPVWSATAAQDFRASPAVSSGYIYASSIDGTLHAYKAPSPSPATTTTTTAAH